MPDLLLRPSTVRVRQFSVVSRNKVLQDTAPILRGPITLIGVDCRPITTSLFDPGPGTGGILIGPLLPSRDIELVEGFQVLFRALTRTTSL